MPKIIESPDVVSCEYAEKKGWPHIFRIGAEVCQVCNMTYTCRFHPAREKTRPTRRKRRELLPDLKDVSSDLVLAQFPSSTLRRYQKEIIVRAADAFRSGKRCIILAAPTGFGKSYVNAAFSSVVTSFYTSPQLVLIDQIMADPHLARIFLEIRGKRNYRCYYEPNRSVNVGKCVTANYACKERSTVCPYWKQKEAALNAPAVITSLAYLFLESLAESSETYLGTRTLLVLDEAHNLEEQSLNHISLKIGPFTLPPDLYKKIQPELLEIHTDDQVKSLLERLEAYLRDMVTESEKIAESTGLSVIQAEDLDRVRRYLTSYETYKSSKSEWVWQLRNDELTLQPVFAGEFLNNLIWKRGKYYIISSATILDYQAYVRFTGLSNLLREDEIEFLTVPSTFPVENRPIIDATVGPLSMQNLAMNMPRAIKAVEEILRKETGNVAIHCHSYNHQHRLVEGLSAEFESRLIIHSGRDRREKLKEWMTSRGKVFVSVAFSEGQDWKYDMCDAQILLKVPYPDMGDPRVKRRLELGFRKWYENQAMLEVIQAYGRAIRAEDDKAKFYIVDGSFNRLFRECHAVVPVWFKEALPPSLLQH